MGTITIVVLSTAGSAMSAAKPSKAIDRPTPSQKADAAVAAGAAGVKKALATGDFELAMELLKRATVVDTEAPADTTGGIGVLTVCHGAVSHRTTVAVAGVSLGWRQVRLSGWCWGGGRITSWGDASYTADTAFPYCWTNTATHHGWYNSPTRRYTYTVGTLGGNSGFGCVAVGNRIAPAIYYRDGGSYSYTA